MTATDYIAIYGAIVATLVFAWDIAKWLTSGPYIKSSTTCHVTYKDSRTIRTEIEEDVTTHIHATYCHIEIANVGDRATTIINVEGTHKKAKKQLARLFCTAEKFIPHQEKELPFILEPGEVWSARFEMEDVVRLAERGRPVILVRLSHRRKPLLMWLRDWEKYPVPS